MKKLLQQCFIFIFLGFVQLASAQQVFTVLLTGVQETPNVTTQAKGILTGTLTGASLVITGSFDGLSSDYSASHIHLGVAGVAGPVQYALVPTLSVDNRSGDFEGASNTFTLTTDQLAALQARGLYINIHSDLYPAGEIRGQLLPDSDDFFFANLFGVNETDPVLSGASGAISLELDGTTLIVSGSFAGLESDFSVGAHIHLGLPGINGSIVFNLTPTFAGDNRSGVFLAAQNTFTLTPTQIEQLYNFEFYANVHSVNHPTGEIRGQIVETPIGLFNSVLSGGSENPSVNTDAAGRYLVAVYGEGSIVIAGSFSNLSSDFTAAHIHAAPFGSNGPIVVPVTPVLSGDLLSGTNTATEATLTSTQLDLLFKRKTYINVHSQNYPNGEIRGQLLPPSNYYFNGKFHGFNELVPVPVENNGGVVVEWLSNKIILSGSFKDLTNDYDTAHIHNAETGVNGPIVFGLRAEVNSNVTSGTFEADSNTFIVNPNQIAELAAQRLYANIHTADFPNGEVRAQLMREINEFPEASSITSPADGADITLEGNPTELINIDFSDVTDPDGDKVIYVWQLSTDANFNETLLTVNTGTTAQASIEQEVLQSLLAGIGVTQGEETELFHRVITSDGSLLNYSDTLSVNVTVGVLSSTTKATNVELKIYPNPTDGQVFIIYTNSKSEKASVQVVDVFGKILLEDESVEDSDKLNIEDLQPGLYFVNVQTAGKVIKSEKILVK